MDSEESYIQTMSEAELAGELKKSLLVLATSSPDKRSVYRTLFSSLGKDANGNAGLDLFFTDSGALGIAPVKTPEKTGKYEENLVEKAIQQLHDLQKESTADTIRRRLTPADGMQNEFDPQHVNIMGMTEDSGWKLIFNNATDEHKFTRRISQLLERKFRPEDHHIIDNILSGEEGFPGPDLKPIQERLEGGFDGLMKLIHKAAEETGIDDLRYKNTIYVSFSSPRLKKYFIKTIESEGRLLTKDEYTHQLLDIKSGEAINADMVQVPDTKPGVQGADSFEVLMRNGLYTRSNDDLPAEFSRRKLTKYLQDLIGKRSSTEHEKERILKIAYINPQSLEANAGQTKAKTPFRLPQEEGYEAAGVPTLKYMMEHPNAKEFGDADVVVLIPQKMKIEDGHLKHNPNAELVIKSVVTAATDPESMRVPVVLYNKSGQFNNELKLLTDMFVQGRMMGNAPVYVANSKQELHTILGEIKDFQQRAPLIRGLKAKEQADVEQQKMARIPKDGIFTVFIGGGHANNTKRDINDAKDFGYHCASKGWRIITGAGALEGSMGAVHTGFVQFYLDKLQNSGDSAFKTQLKPYLDEEEGRYNAEKLIAENPALVNEMADCAAHLIPRDMFYGYSMQPLLDMESPLKTPPPGITYSETGNRVRRMYKDALLSSGTKILMSGGIGTDEEFIGAVKQHLEGRKRKYDADKKGGPSNDNNGIFADGTHDDDGTIIIYNKDHQLDRLLQNYHLLNKDARTEAKKSIYNIVVVDSLAGLIKASSEREKSWLAKVRPTLGLDAESQEKNPVRRQER